MYFHVWFGTKYRRRMLIGEIGTFIEDAFRQIADEKGLDLAECKCYVDHAHLLLEAQNRASLSKAVQLLKGGAAYKTFRQYPELKLDAKTNNLWREGFGCRFVPHEQVSTVRRYIQTQDERPQKFDRPYAMRKNNPGL